MTDRKFDTDLLVAGGGNAALCAAISARRQGASVLLVEHASKNMRGGNSRHTRNLRLAHDKPTDVLTESYPVEEYWQDLIRVTDGKTDENLSRMLLDKSLTVSEWMKKQGVHFQPSLAGTLSLGRTNAFFLGGGKALVNAYYVTAEDLGIDIRYESELVALELDENQIHKATVRTGERDRILYPKTVVVATGGFQSNEEWMREAWGPSADNFLIRGTPFNKGRPLRNLLDQDCISVGDPTQGHMVAIDGRAPKYDGGITTRLDCVPFSIVVNRDCQRFYDEGEDIWPKRYAIWGRLIAQQPDQVGFSIIDSKSIDKFMPSVFDPIIADSIPELASKLGLDGEKLEQTINTFNNACQPGEFDIEKLDGLKTKGLDSNKTNWARKIDKPPYYGYPLRPGITFTYLGLKINDKAQIFRGDEQPIPNIFAAGEIMAGNILGQGYLAGTGMTIGTIFGRIAGEEAAKYVRQN